MRFLPSPWPANKTEALGYQEGRSNHMQLIPIGCYHMRRTKEAHLAHAYCGCFRGRIERTVKIPLSPG